MRDIAISGEDFAAVASNLRIFGCVEESMVELALPGTSRAAMAVRRSAVRRTSSLSG